MISPADLKYFTTVAETQNLSRAAERLGVSQPSLSLAMQRIESAIGTPLMQRSRKGIHLTREGEKLLSHAQAMIQQWDDIRDAVLSSTSQAQGHYTIGCHPSVAQNILPAILPQLLQDYPHLNLSLKHGGSRRITEDVISMKTDIGFVVNPVRHPDLIIYPMYQGDLTLWRSGKVTPLNDIKGEDAVLLADPDLMRTQMIIKEAEKKNITFKRIVKTDNLDVIAAMAVDGCGIALLPTKDAGRYNRKLKHIENAPVYHDDHCAIYRAENKNVRAIQVIMKRIRSGFAV